MDLGLQVGKYWWGCIVVVDVTMTILTLNRSNENPKSEPCTAPIVLGFQVGKPSNLAQRCTPRSGRPGRITLNPIPLTLAL